MARAEDLFKKRTKKQAVEKRTKKRKEQAKEYNKPMKTSRNSSDQAFIRGDVKQLAKNNAYASKGGYLELDAQSIRKQREVKRDYATNPKRKQAIMRSANPNGTKFRDHLNTQYSDGYQTARMNTKQGQPIRNTIKMAGGIAKDVVVDPVMDIMKMADYGAGIGTGALTGAFEQSANVGLGLAEGKGAKNYWNKDLIKNNVKASIDESNKTGWGHGFGKYYKDVNNRMDEEYGRQLSDDEKSKRDFALEIAGGATDIAMGGLNAGDFSKAFSQVGKATSKGVNTLDTAMKAQNELGAVAGFKAGNYQDELAEAVRKAKTKYSGGKASGKALDTLTGGNKALDDNQLIRGLNKSYNNAVGKPEIQTGKPKVDEFIGKMRRPGNMPSVGSRRKDIEAINDFKNRSDDFGSVIPNSKQEQRRIDGRVLNKKYTQTKDGYAPRTVNEFVESLDNNKSTLKSGAYDDALNKYLNDVDLNNKDVKYWEKLLDNSSEEKASAIYENLKEVNPSMYNKLMRGVNHFDDIVADGINMSDFVGKSKNNIYNGDEQLDMFNQLKSNMYETPKSVAKYEKSNISELTLPERKEAMMKFLGDRNIFTSPTYNLDSLKKVAKRIKPKGANSEDIVKFLNESMFGGRDVIVSKINNKNLKEFLDNEVKYLESIKKLRNTSNPVERTKLNLKLNEYGGKRNMFVSQLTDENLFNKQQYIKNKYGNSPSGFKKAIETNLQYIKKLKNGEVKMPDGTPFPNVDKEVQRVLAQNDKYNKAMKSAINERNMIGDLPDNKWIEYSSKNANRSNISSLESNAKRIDTNAQETFKSSPMESQIEDKTHLNKQMWDIVAGSVGDGNRFGYHKDGLKYLEKQVGLITKEMEDALDNLDFSKANELSKTVKELNISVDAKKQIIKAMATEFNKIKTLVNGDPISQQRVVTDLLGDTYKKFPHLRSVSENKPVIKPKDLVKKPFSNLEVGKGMNEASANIARRIAEQHGIAEPTKINFGSKYEKYNQQRFVENKREIQKLAELRVLQSYTKGAGGKVMDDALSLLIKSHMDNMKKSIPANEYSKLQKGVKGYINDMKKAYASYINPEGKVMLNPLDTVGDKKFYKSVDDELAEALESKALDMKYDDAINSPNSSVALESRAFDASDVKPGDKGSLTMNLQRLASKFIGDDVKPHKPSLKETTDARLAHLYPSEYKLIENKVQKKPTRAKGKASKQSKFSYSVDDETGEVFYKTSKLKPEDIMKKSDELSPKEMEYINKQLKKRSAFDKVEESSKKVSKIERTPKEQTMLDAGNARREMRRTGKGTIEKAKPEPGINPFTGEILEDGAKVNPITGEVMKKGEPRITKKGIRGEDLELKRAKDGRLEWQDNDGNFQGKPTFKDVDKYHKAIDELAEQGIDASKKPPKEKPKNMPPNLYKKWLNTWKKGVTVYNPGWHVQNFFQNKGQNYLALGNKAFAPQTDARQIMKTINGKNAKNINVNGLGNTELADIAKKLGVVDSFGDDVQMGNKLDNSKFMQKLGESEKTARLHHWITQMRDGMSPEQATKSVNKYLFDYGDMSKTDRAIRDYVDPFWSFHKNNAKMLVESGVKHPFRMSAIGRSERGLGQEISDEERQSEESSYGMKQVPGKSYHDRVSNADFNYLYKNNMMPDFEDGTGTDDDDIYSKLNPLIQVAMQMKDGEGEFGNKVVDGEEAKWGEITKAERMKEIGMQLNPFLPTLINTMDKVKEREAKVEDDKMGTEITEKQILNDWIKYITGNKANWYRNM